MNPRTTRRFAGLAGWTLVAATVNGVASLAVLGTLLDGSDFVAGVAANSDRVAVFAALSGLMGLACAGVGFAMYPILRRFDAGLAMAVAGLRAIEGTLFLVSAAIAAALIAVGQDAAAAGTVGSAAVGSSASALRAIANQCGTFASLPFAVGAFIYYWLFWRHELMPRWLSGWGLVTIVTYLGIALYAIVSRTEFADYSLLLMPFAVQEMVFAVWLIAKGLREPAESGQTAAPAVAPA